MTTDHVQALARTLSKHHRISATDVRRIGGLMNRWWMATDQGKADVAASAMSRLHDLLKARHLGVRFDMGGLLFWVDADTPTAIVEIDEAFLL